MRTPRLLIMIALALSCAHRTEGPLVFRVASPDFDPHFAYVEDLTGEAKATTKSFEDGLLRLSPKNPLQSWRIVVMYPAATFGRVMLTADNGGAGYRGDEGELTLEAELLVTASRRLAARVAWAESEGWDLDTAAAEQIAAQGQRARDDDPDSLADTLDRTLWAAENLELDIADAATPSARGASVVVTVTDPQGQPVPGAHVELTPDSPGLLIGNGAPLPMGGPVEEPILQSFNYITLPFYLPQLKDARVGLTGLQPRHDNARFLAERGLALKGHPLVWLFDPHTPQWLSDLSYQELKEYVDEHVYSIVVEFAGEVDWWDVINEAHSWANSLDLGSEQLVEITGVAAAAAKRANPDATVVVNTCLPWGDYIAWRGDDSMMTPYEYLQRCIDASVPFDVAGIQMYNAYASPFPCRDLTAMSDCLDRYSRLGKPIHVTEFVVPSAGGEFGTWHGDQWSPQLQAEYTDGFYRVCAGKPYVEAITWWSIVDRDKEWAHTGLLFTETEPKPALSVVRGHMERWTRPPAGRTGPDGTAVLRAWAGRFRITATAERGSADGSLTLKPGEAATASLALAGR